VRRMKLMSRAQHPGMVWLEIPCGLAEGHNRDTGGSQDDTTSTSTADVPPQLSRGVSPVSSHTQTIDIHPFVL
jgi:hypothetical protein